MSNAKVGTLLVVIAVVLFLLGCFMSLGALKAIAFIACGWVANEAYRTVNADKAGPTGGNGGAAFVSGTGTATGGAGGSVKPINNEPEF